MNWRVKKIHWALKCAGPGAVYSGLKSFNAIMFSGLFVWLVGIAPGVSAAGSDVMAVRSTDDEWYMSVVKYGWQGASCAYDQYGYCLRNCTSYVAQRLAAAGVPSADYNNLGNGGDWYSNAGSRGIPVGSNPKPGSVAVSMDINHVAIVDGVNADGTVNVKSYSGLREEPWFENGSTRYSKFIYFTGSEPAKEIRKGGRLARGETLRPGEYLSSGNVLYKLLFRNDGELSLIKNGRQLWSAGTTGKGGNRLVMQGDGNLVMYKDGGRPVWHTRTYNTATDRFIMQTDGNFVGYAGSKPKWASNTGGHRAYNYAGSGLLKTGQAIKRGQYLRSSDRRYALLLQLNGNLVLYGAGYRVLWGSGTAGQGSDRLVIQGDGNLVLYDGSNPRWASRTVGRGDRAVLQSDGNFVIYKSDSPSWATGTHE